jgi:hypothetical protein
MVFFSFKGSFYSSSFLVFFLHVLFFKLVFLAWDFKIISLSPSDCQKMPPLFMSFFPVLLHLIYTCVPNINKDSLNKII